MGILQLRQAVHSRIPALTLRNLNRSVFVPLGAEPEVAGATGDGIGEISVRMSTGQAFEAKGEAIRRILALNHPDANDFEIVEPRELLRQAQQTQRVFNGVLGSVAGISLLVGAIGIMNIMLASVSERSREIGIRRAIGASRQHILIQFLLMEGKPYGVPNVVTHNDP